MPRSRALILIGAFLVTRLAGAWLVLEPGLYPDAPDELVKYEANATAILDAGGKPYGSVPLEYPPGALPLILAPEALPGDPVSYAAGYVGLQLLLDVLALIGLWRLGLRWGSMAGAWLWVSLVPALGPIVFVRLDLLPAVASIWAVERAAAGAWLSSGASLSIGIVTKIYPVFFLPVMLWTAPQRKRLMFCLGALWVVVPLIGFGDALDDVARSVLGYHSHRSIHVESTWATPLLIAMRNGYESVITLSFGAFHIEGGIAPTLKLVANICSVLVVVGTTALATRRVKTGQVERMASAMLMILLATMSVGLVFSPQFMIWLFGLGGVVICRSATTLEKPILALVPIALLTQSVYPFLYRDLLELDAMAIFVLATRNVLIVTLAAVVIWRIAAAEPVPDVRDHERSDERTPPVANFSRTT